VLGKYWVLWTISPKGRSGEKRRKFQSWKGRKGSRERHVKEKGLVPTVSGKEERIRTWIRYGRGGHKTKKTISG